MLVADEEDDDWTPLSKLMTKKQDAHLRLVQQVVDLKAKAELIHDNPSSPNGGVVTILDLPENTHGVREDLMDL